MKQLCFSPFTMTLDLWYYLLLQVSYEASSKADIKIKL